MSTYIPRSRDHGRNHVAALTPAQTAQHAQHLAAAVRTALVPAHPCATEPAQFAASLWCCAVLHMEES